MNVTVHPTDRIVDVVGSHGVVPGRVWEGTTVDGTEVVFVVTRVAVPADRGYDLAEFERLLDPQPASDMSREAIPNRLVL